MKIKHGKIKTNIYYCRLLFLQRTKLNPKSLFTKFQHLGCVPQLCSILIKYVNIDVCSV